MRRSRLGLIIGLVGALIAIGYGLYLLGAQRGAEPAAPDPYRYGFVLIALLAAGGGWMIDWNAALAAVLLADAAVIALLAFGLSVPGLILIVLLGGAALLIVLPDLFQPATPRPTPDRRAPRPCFFLAQIPSGVRGQRPRIGIGHQCRCRILTRSAPLVGHHHRHLVRRHEAAQQFVLQHEGRRAVDLQRLGQ